METQGGSAIDAIAEPDLVPAADEAASTPAVTAPPLCVLAPPRGAIRSSRLPSKTLTWLLDGWAWPWLRAAVDASVLCAVATDASARTTVMLLPLVPLAIVVFWLRGLYRQRISAHVLRTAGAAAGSLASAIVLLALLDRYVLGRPVPEATLLRSGLLAFVAVMSARLLLLATRQLARVTGAIGKPTVIVGAGHVGARIAAQLSGHPGYGLKPIGFLDDVHTGDAAPADESPLPLLGNADALADVVPDMGIRHVVIAFARERDQDLVPLIRRCNELGLEISLVPRLFESINHRLARDSIGTLPLHIMQPTNPRNWEFAVKHMLDRTLAALALMLLAPLLAATALAIKLTSPGPVLFRQRRIGRDGRAFEMLKFRSMRVADQAGWEGPVIGLAPGGVEGDDRRTPIGRLLRRTSIDELPQLWNVVCSDMSLVGPRPERPEYVDRFRDEVRHYDDRHRVKSGITGAAQVNGLRGKTGLADRIQWDNYYIENWSLVLDLKILAQTVRAVLRPVE